jgi:uncharacterized protein YdaU (DUF1376 family)
MPWFPFYVDDFVASPKVARMSMEEVGVYLFLLCQQHQEGAVVWPCERIANALRGHERSIEYVLAECFRETPEGWKNARLERIHGEQNAKSERAARAAKARWDRDIDGAAAVEDLDEKGDANASPMHNERICINDAIQSQNQNQRKTDRPVERRKTQLPDTWTPKDSHKAKAIELGLNLAKEVEGFRFHAKANGRVQIDWDMAFFGWLHNAIKFGGVVSNGNGKRTDVSWLDGLK